MCSVADELRSYLDRHGREKIANALGVEIPTAYRKTNPNDRHAGLHAVEVSLLCNGLDDYRLLQSICGACGGTFLQLKPGGKVDLPRITKEVGEALVKASGALADNVLTKTEARECIPELLDALQVLTAFLKQCQDAVSD